MIFGRTELPTGVSKAKFDARADVEVRFAVAPRKRLEKPNFQSESFVELFFRRRFFFDLESFESHFGRSSQI